jgi:hypothetical protein
MRANRVYVKVLLHRARSILSRLLTARGMGPVGLQDQSNEAPRTVHISTESKAIL